MGRKTPLKLPALLINFLRDNKNPEYSQSMNRSKSQTGRQGSRQASRQGEKRPQRKKTLKNKINSTKVTERKKKQTRRREAHLSASAGMREGGRAVWDAGLRATSSSWLGAVPTYLRT